MIEPCHGLNFVHLGVGVQERGGAAIRGGGVSQGCAVARVAAHRASVRGQRAVTV
mgnify:CR=1 FL=1